MRLKLFSGWIVAVVTAATLPVAASAETSGATFASTMSDSRIDESSSLAISKQYPNIAYTANDENDPIYAVEISTGRVVGSSRLMTATMVPTRVIRYMRKKCDRTTDTCVKVYFVKKHKRTKKVRRTILVEQRTPALLLDPEAMSMDSSGRVWLADLGDNSQDRRGGALYAFREPALGAPEVVATRYPIAYPGGASYNVETLLINPVTDEKFLVSKTSDSAAKLFRLPTSLSTVAPNVAVDTGVAMPSMISDGDFSPTGRRVILRDGAKGSTSSPIFDPSNWAKLGTSYVPSNGNKGESLSFDPSSGRFLVGFEGSNSPLYWVTPP